MKKLRLMKKLQLFLIISLLIMPIIFLSSCESSKNIALEIETPVLTPPEELKVTFIDKPQEGGLFLSYFEYRKLATNITRLRQYISDLEDAVDFDKDKEK